MTKRFRAVVVCWAAMAVPACNTPTRPSERYAHIVPGDTTIVVDTAGYTLRLYLNKHVLVAGDTLAASTMLVNHTSQPYLTATSPCSLANVTTMLERTYPCGVMSVLVTVAPGDSIGRSEVWYVSSPPGAYAFTVQEAFDVAAIELEVERP